MSMQPSIDLISDVTESTFDSLVLEGNGRRIVEFMSYGRSIGAGFIWVSSIPGPAQRRVRNPR